MGDETSVILARCRVLDVDFEMCKALRVRETRLFQKLDMPVNRKPARFIIEGGTVWLDEISIDQDAAGRERFKASLIDIGDGLLAAEIVQSPGRDYGAGLLSVLKTFGTPEPIL